MRFGRATVVSRQPLPSDRASRRRSEAQFEPPRVFGGAPAASWIAPPDTPGDAYGVFHFRRTLELPSRPERFTVHVSGDNRYRLFVNGQQVSSGPQRSDLMHWRYETLDLAPHLRAGKNVLAALVWNWGARAPRGAVQPPHRFPHAGRTPSARPWPTPDREWKVLRNPGYEPIPVRRPGRRRLLRGPARRVGGRQPLSRGAGSRRTSPTTAGRRPRSPRAGAPSERSPAGRPSPAKRMLWQLVPALPPAHGREGGPLSPP